MITCDCDQVWDLSVLHIYINSEGRFRELFQKIMILFNNSDSFDHVNMKINVYKIYSSLFLLISSDKSSIQKLNGETDPLRFPSQFCALTVYKENLGK